VAVEDLVASGRATERNGRLTPPAASREPAPPVELGERELLALELIRADGASPRPPGVLADHLACTREEAVAALDALTRAGRAVLLKPGVYYEADVLGELTAIVLRAAKEAGGAITISEAKTLVGTSRKYAQALLEHLDSRHLTVRHGDRHLLRRSRDARVEEVGA
jgi:selenocysteine-specific elongation factor